MVGQVTAIPTAAVVTTVIPMEEEVIPMEEEVTPMRTKVTVTVTTATDIPMEVEEVTVTATLMR